MDYAAALAFLDGRQETRWKLGLSRIEALLAAAGDPHLGLPAVHVAGTNGKGSFCAMLASALGGAGLRVGLTTSPHLESPRERIVVDGRPIPEADFARHIARLARVEPEECTYFELVTAAAFLHFKERGVDAAVVEVGLGGRLDATNALKKPLLSVVTSIGYDHMQHLGDTLEKIAAEKAGIVKAGTPLLCGVEDPLVKAVFVSEAKRAGARLRSAPAPLRRLSEDWDAGVQRAVGAGGTEATVPLLGDAALANAAMVLAALEELRAAGLELPEKHCLAGLAAARWPGRFQVLSLPGGRRVVVDGAHNEAALEAFAATWRRSPYSKGDPLVVMGVLADKDAERLAVLAAPLAARFVATRPPSPRALAAADLAALLRRRGARSVEAVEDPAEALRRLAADPAPSGAVVGSFYLAGRALGALAGAPA